MLALGANGRGRAGLVASVDAILATIPNKTLLLRADRSTAANGATLNASPWDDEIRTSDFTGTATWETNSINGYRAMLSSGSGQRGASGLDLSTINGGDNSVTVWFSERRSGSQGSASFPGGNSKIYSDQAGYFAVGFMANSNRIYIFYNDGSNEGSIDTGFTLSDGIPYVGSFRVDTSGFVRVNFNGITSNPGQISLSFPLGTMAVNSWGAGQNRAHFYAASSDAVSNTLQDALVSALLADPRYR